MKGIKTDLSTEYMNEVIKELFQSFNIEHSFSTAYHHQTLGLVERGHRILNEYIRSYLNGNLDEWDTYADYFAFNYNTTPNAVSNYKYSPFELIFAKHCNVPSDFLSNRISPIYNVENVVHEMKYRLQKAHKDTKEMIDVFKKRNKEYYDKKINVTDFKIGEKIKIKKEPYDKFQYIYSGPFEILEIKNENVIINLNGKKYKIHKNRINKY